MLAVQPTRSALVRLHGGGWKENPETYLTSAHSDEGHYDECTSIPRVEKRIKIPRVLNLGFETAIFHSVEADPALIPSSKVQFNESEFPLYQLKLGWKMIEQYQLDRSADILYHNPSDLNFDTNPSQQAPLEQYSRIHCDMMSEVMLMRINTLEKTYTRRDQSHSTPWLKEGWLGQRCNGRATS